MNDEENEATFEWVENEMVPPNCCGDFVVSSVMIPDFDWAVQRLRIGLD